MVDEFNVQNRGGKGVRGISTYDDDMVEQILAMSTHDYLLVFTNFGKVYRIRGFHVPSASRTSKGVPIINLVDLAEDEEVTTLVKVPEEKDESIKYAFFATKNGLVKRVSLEEFESIQRNGKIAIGLRGNDELASVKLTSGDDEIILASSNGKAVRFHEEEVRSMGRTASGVIGIQVEEGHELVSMGTNREGQDVLSITANGYGKRTNLEEYRKTRRGTKGVNTIVVNERNGELAAMRMVNGDEELMLISDSGNLIRINVEDIGTYGRSTMGVRIFNLNEGDELASVSVFDPDVVEENSEIEEEIDKED